MEVINITATTREKALAWWNTLGNKDKDLFQRQCNINRNYITLTGREVEQIWTEKVQSPRVSKLTKGMKSYAKKKNTSYSLLTVNYAFQSTLNWGGANFILTEQDLKDIRKGVNLTSAEITGKHIWTWFHSRWTNFVTSKSYFDMGVDFLNNLERYNK